MPFGQLISAMLAKRMDVVASNIQSRQIDSKPSRSPGRHGGTALPSWSRRAIPRSSKFRQLKGKKIGAIAGSAADEYLRKIGVEVTAFQTDAEEFSGIGAARVDAIVEDDVKVLEYLSANKGPRSRSSRSLGPRRTHFTYGYGYARFALRKEDCSLRAAYTQALAEVRGNGNVSYILKKYGLSNRNLFFFPL